jgi:hypothetical protein
MAIKATMLITTSSGLGWSIGAIPPVSGSSAARPCGFDRRAVGADSTGAILHMGETLGSAACPMSRGRHACRSQRATGIGRSFRPPQSSEMATFDPKRPLGRSRRASSRPTQRVHPVVIAPTTAATSVMTAKPPSRPMIWTILDKAVPMRTSGGVSGRRRSA